ncbi:MAG: hypothetical protein B7Y99_04260 [Caulobacterales bacterium 32-69-10]|nr:MAG: hypothetical protein B7Y99_04260 [Caulobacterales bacterium 32-69-10]
MQAIQTRFGGNIRRIGLAAGAAMLVAGCADLGRVMAVNPQPVDPNSAVAEQVRAASRADVKTPRFRDVPPLPKNVRPARAFKTAVTESGRAGDQLTTYIAANPPSLAVDPAQTEAFAAAERARIPADQRGVAPAPAGSEEFAARLRELATPPPPPK